MIKSLQLINEPWDKIPHIPIEESSNIFLCEGSGNPPHTPPGSQQVQQTQPPIPPQIQIINMASSPWPRWLAQDVVVVLGVHHDLT